MFQSDPLAMNPSDMYIEKDYSQNCNDQFLEQFQVLTYYPEVFPRFDQQLSQTGLDESIYNYGINSQRNTPNFIPNFSDNNNNNNNSNNNAIQQITFFPIDVNQISNLEENTMKEENIYNFGKSMQSLVKDQKKQNLTAFLQSFFLSLIKRIRKNRFPYEFLYQKIKNLCEKHFLDFDGFIKTYLCYKRVGVTQISTILSQPIWQDFLKWFQTPEIFNEYSDKVYYESDKKKYAKIIIDFVYQNITCPTFFSDNWKKFQKYSSDSSLYDEKYAKLSKVQQKQLKELEFLLDQCKLNSYKEFEILINNQIFQVQENQLNIKASIQLANFIKKSIEVIDSEKKKKSDDKDENNDKCCVCFGYKPNIVFIPCGHICCCEKCSSQLDTKKFDECPICKSKINQRQKCYY